MRISIFNIACAVFITTFAAPIWSGASLAAVAVAHAETRRVYLDSAISTERKPVTATERITTIDWVDPIRNKDVNRVQILLEENAPLPASQRGQQMLIHYVLHTRSEYLNNLLKSRLNGTHIAFMAKQRTEYALSLGSRVPNALADLIVDHALAKPTPKRHVLGNLDGAMD